MTDRLDDAYSPEHFRERGHALVEQLATYLAQALAGQELPVLRWLEPAPMLERWAEPLGREPSMPFPQLIERLLELGGHQHHPGYLGYQVSCPLPVAVLADFAAALLNNGMASYEAGPASSAMERRLVVWLANQLGWDGELAEGALTSGGSAGNLTALLGARQARAGWDVWQEGASAGPPLCVLGPREAHYSVARAVQIMGWGAAGIQPVELDRDYRLSVASLEQSLTTARARGRRVIGVCATAGSSATGSIDPLPEIADFCAAHGLWFHVDGAHGASLALSTRYRERLRGIERADSVVWDAHKLLGLPALSTAVLFRDGRHAAAAFRQDASYLYADRQPADAAASHVERWPDRGLLSLECTKRMIAVPLYATLAVLGAGVLDDYVTRQLDLAARFAELLGAAPDFETPIVRPDTNIVCFRHVPDSRLEPAALDALQERLRKQLLADGRFYVVQTRLGGRLWLRTTLMSVTTGERELVALLATLRSLARSGVRVAL